MVSILILTRNEEEDLPGCLASVAWSDDVHVFDSFSTDQTLPIAESSGAHVQQRVFDDFASQRNAALERCHFRHPWVFVLDADERVPTELALELQQLPEKMARQPLAAERSNVQGFRVRRRDFFRDRWLRHAQISPYYLRLVRPEAAHYTRAVNEVLQVAGQVADLVAPLDHYPFSKGISRWLQKHDVYSTMEADLILRRQGLQQPELRKALRSPDFHERRLHQKALFYKLPGRPVLKWLYMVFGRRAFLDGAAGMSYATLQALYEYMIVLKTRELRDRSDTGG